MLPTSLLKVFSRPAVTVVMIMMFAVAASAYTLVLKDGRRIKIPDEFTVTQTTLSYEISPGFSRSMQVIFINIAATERANGEAPGSFFRRRQAPIANQDVEPSRPAVRTVTNRDLEGIRQRRIASEKAYEARRKELGLSTIDEARRRQSAEADAFLEQVRSRSITRAQEERYWRGRARELRTQLAIVDSQISYVRARVNEVSENSLDNLVITEVYPIGPNQGSRFPSPNQYPYPSGYPFPNQYPYPGQYPYPYPYPNGYPYPNVYGYPPPNDNAVQRVQLTNRLDDLLTKRAALATQWWLLEDEARNARVPQVWLLP